MVTPGASQGNRIIDEEAEAQIKYNRLRKRVHDSKNKHREIHERNVKFIEEWKEMVVTFNRKLEYLERGIVQLEGKVIKRTENCQNAEGAEG